MPKPVVAMVAGYAIGGGHVLHVVCDLTIAAENARFGQTGPRVGSFDGGYGASILAAQIGQKRAKEIWLLCRQYDAQQALDWGLVNAVVPLDELERETVAWCREMLALSPFALRLRQGQLQRRRGRLRRAPAARPRRQPPLLRLRGGARGAHRVLRAAPARLLALPAPAVRIWLMAARPRTLPAAIAPVLVGTSLAIRDGRFHPLAFVAALLGAMLIQIGTNLSNDYSDARRGADTEERIGPVRVTAGGLLPPRRVLVATYLTFGAAVLCGVYLIAVAGWLLLAVGAASILAGVLYTGGPRPYGYEGLGEVFVFLFFGIVAVSGSYFVQRKALPWQAFVLAGPGRPADRRDPRRQQRPRHRHRPPRRQAHARGAARARAHARALRGDGRRRVRELVGAVVRRMRCRPGCSLTAAAAPLAVARRAHRAHAHRRPVAQRRARRDREARARLLRAALRRRAGRAADGADAPSARTLRFARPARRPPTARCASAS